ncbi:MAG: KEOPS complex subunit Pcc1 [Thermoplasmatota archaeon]
MSPAFLARLELEFSSEREARIVHDALAPEAAAELARARATLTRDGAKVIAVLEAADPAALRAAVNSFLRWAKVAEDAGARGSR